MIRHILVAVDGSEGAKRAAAFAKELATQLDARITMLHVLEPIPVVNVGFAEFYGVAQRPPTEDEMKKLRQALHEEAAGFPSDRIEVVLEYGTPAETIVEQAEKRDADLVVMGARGMGAVGRFLVGSVSDRVVHQSKRNVLVVR